MSNIINIKGLFLEDILSNIDDYYFIIGDKEVDIYHEDKYNLAYKINKNMLIKCLLNKVGGKYEFI